MTPGLYTYPIKYEDINGKEKIRLAFIDEGKGNQTILFVHGLANYLPVWNAQIKHLSKSFRCIAVDLPGNGLSSSGDYPYSMFFYAETIRLFIEQLQLKQVILVGHSMGGQIGMMAALRYPELIDKLILLAPAGIEEFDSHEKFLMIQMLAFGEFLYADELHLEHAIKESFYKTTDGMKTIIADLKKILLMHKGTAWRNMCKKSIAGMLNEQVAGFLPQLSIPTLVVFGEKDKFIPSRLLHPSENAHTISQKSATLIPDCTYKVIPDCGHFLQIENATEINELIYSYISGLLIRTAL
jgi:pimeloyl-ACP methyl ester carboxylesterase